MKRKSYLPTVDPLLIDLVLLVSVSMVMSIVFITAAHMVYIQLAGY